MRIGIALATYNSSGFLSKCLDSILAQKFDGEVKIFACDDASTDDTVSRLKEREIDHVTLSKNSGGCAKPYNVAFSYLANTCDAIWKVDSDDYLLKPCAIQKMADTLGDHDWVNCHAMGFGEREWELTCNPNATLAEFRQANQLTAFGMIRSSVWKESGGFDENCAYEDWEWWVRMLKRGKTYSVVTEPIYAYRTHANQHHKKTGQQHEANLNYIIKKHYE